MNIKRFTAATSREALAKARMAFGDGTLILSNRATANGVEVVATAEDTLHSLNHDHIAEGQAQPALQTVRSEEPPRRSAAPAQQPAAPKAPPATARRSVEADTEQLAMSTLSFQDYVRERMLRRRHEAMHGSPPPNARIEPTLPERLPTFAEQQRAPTFAERARDTLPERSAERERDFGAAERTDLAAEAAYPRSSAHEAPRAPVRESTPAPRPAPVVARHNPLHHHIPTDLAIEPRHSGALAAPAAPAANPQGLMSELQSMKALIEDRFNTLAWLGQARQDPIQSNLMLKLIRAGYSPVLARAILERLPEDLGAADAVRWLMEVLERNLKTDAHSLPLYEEGGIFALVGATGVGKTTTTAKLAALCARQYGPGSVGLITLDTYRIGAHEQLRSFGRMLGVVAHLAHDQAALQDLLGLLSGKKMVLIDTTGVAPRDPRKRELHEVLDLPGIQRLLVLNAGCHGDTLDDVLDAFKTDGPQQALLSKVDEAVKLGPAVDALIRHQAVLRGVTNGQRVPEDWEAANAHQLVQQSMRAPAKSAFDPKAMELNFFFTPGGSSEGGHYA
ncbi:flagellar biosynthesis protein FlhF [Acidovorax sp. HDW3]|uniref:flagellar biosynthesis protein FlhF n=1 Tax=Acidovorax sp. HDW3 TaxID=2714923 RepID=UPI001409E95E|nr:flagellar biosynthesis protein FlhF [Acidovorax sp. HDW3]QIL45098.1 flagellar biosynthesis protein FlhF [Acidovorax sp. HDW3]